MKMRSKMTGGAAALATILTAGMATGQAGLLTGGAEDLAPPLRLSAGQPLAEQPYELEAGGFYELTIEADGSQELGLSGAEFFRNMWVNEIVVNDIEIRPIGVDSLEFDAAGEATISFVAIRPGSFVLRIPGTTGETQMVTFNVTDPNGFGVTTTGATADEDEGEPEGAEDMD